MSIPRSVSLILTATLGVPSIACDRGDSDSGASADTGETSTGETSTGGDGCGDGPAPACLEACGSDIALDDALCQDDTWVCSAGVVADECGPGCIGPVPGCAPDCDNPTVVGEPIAATCNQGAWYCPGDVPAEDCPAPTCEGQPPACLDGCSDIALQDAVCEGGAWSCAEGTLADECGLGCVEGPLVGCAADCTDTDLPGDPVLATCVEEAWYCDDAPADQCPAPTCVDAVFVFCVQACGDEEPAGIPSCTDGAWVCEEGSIPESEC